MVKERIGVVARNTWYYRLIFALMPSFVANWIRILTGEMLVQVCDSDTGEVLGYAWYKYGDLVFAVKSREG